MQGSDARVVLRHRSRDVEIFDEIFVRPRTYDLPAPVAAALRDRASLRVLDLGGNIGLFGIHVLRQLPQAEITSVEPDPFNTPVLERAVAVNDAERRWQVIAACAAASTGSVRFAAGHYADSKVIDGDAADGVDIPALDVFPLIQRSDLVKIDIEGSEWDILFDERFPTVTPAAFVMEWHAQGCPREDARQAAIDAFQGAGYEVDAPPSRFSHGDLWAWRASPGA